MFGRTGIWGRGVVGGSIALALLCILMAQPLAFADDQNRDDEPVGWPLRDSDKERAKQELQRQQPATPLPRRSAVTDQALAAWSASNTSTAQKIPAATPATIPTTTPTPTTIVPAAPLATAVGGASTPAEIFSPEIAPLKRIIPPVRYELIVYTPGDFSISVATAGRLDQMAMRLRGTRDRISIVAHSAGGPGDAQISTHEAVKLSFKRAMLVRLYLIEEGVSPDQIDLEALPQANDDGPTDRVQISPTAKVARR